MLVDRGYSSVVEHLLFMSYIPGSILGISRKGVSDIENVAALERTRTQTDTLTV